MFEVAYITNRGARPYNDDRILINGQILCDTSGAELVYGRCLVGVFDGVGGSQHGDLAAETVADVMKALQWVDISNEEHVISIAEKANADVVKKQKESSTFWNMATTMSCVLLDKDSYLAINTGDSKILLQEADPSSRIRQLSVDHTFIQESLEWGLPMPEGAEHVITRFFGGDNFLPHLANGENCLKEGDVFLVCSDGLSDVVSKNDIRKTLVSDASASVMCNILYNAAVHSNLDDNISIIVVKHVKEER